MQDPENILGLSLSTYAMGIAYYSRNDLRDWSLRHYRGRWSEEKYTHITRTIEKMIQKRCVRCVVIKIPPSTHTTPAVEQLKNGLTRLAKSNHVQIYFYTLEELEFFFSHDVKRTKRSMIEALVEKYPDLLLEYDRVLTNPFCSHEKIYEAVAAIELYRHEFKVV